MEKLLDILSTREIAILFWIFFTLVVMMFSENIRQGLAQSIILLFGKKIGAILVTLTIYVFLLLFLLNKIQLWNVSLIKDTVFWYFTTAIILFFSINKAKDNSYFKKIVAENLKWSLILEFIINFYTFSLTTELIIVPTMTVLLLLQAFADTDSKHLAAKKLLEYITGFVGLVFIIYAICLTLKTYDAVFTIHNLFSFVLPPILTILLIPFLYILAVCMNYETLFMRINFLTRDAEKRKRLKKTILWTAKINLNHITTIGTILNKFDLYNEDNFSLLCESIKKGIT